MVRQSQPPGNESGLCDVILRPGLDKTNKIWDDLRKSLFNPGLTLLPVCSMATPDVPGGDANRRVDERAVRGVWVKDHAQILSRHLGRTTARDPAFGNMRRGVFLCVRQVESDESGPADRRSVRDRHR